MLRCDYILLRRSTSRGNIPAWLFVSELNSATLMHTLNRGWTKIGLPRTGLKHVKNTLNDSETRPHIYAGSGILVVINGVLHSIPIVMSAMNWPFSLMAISWVSPRRRSSFRHHSIYRIEDASTVSTLPATSAASGRPGSYCSTLPIVNPQSLRAPDRSRSVSRVLACHAPPGRRTPSPARSVR